MIELERCKHIYGFDRGLRSSLKNMKQVNVDIPVLANGEFDISVQQEIIEKYNVVADLKAKVLHYEQALKELVVTIEEDVAQSKSVLISDIFATQKGLSKYTKGYGQAHKGEYPVYSASNIAPLTFIETFDYDGKYLTWATNGFAGYIKVIDGKFSINGDRGLLIPKTNKIDIDYIKFVLEPILRGLAKGRKGDNGGDEFTKVYPTMVESVVIPIPIHLNGEPNLDEQQAIAEKYIKIEKIKSLLAIELKKISGLSLAV
jgi:type I restriction enzyme M protein